jgi:hypothetical protein
VQVKFVKIYSLTIDDRVICEVTTEYPLLFGSRPKLSRAWLREVLATAIRSYFMHGPQNSKCGVIKV